MNVTLTLLGLLLSGVAFAGPLNAIPTCYDSKQLPPQSQSMETELFVAIDQTTPLDSKLRQLVADNIKPFIAPNNGFVVLTFSAFTQGHYTELQVSGKLDPLLNRAQRDDVAKPVLLRFDQCMSRQPQQAAQLVGNALRTAFDGTTSEIAKSDVMAGIKAISSTVRQSTARQKVLLIVSDMLENSPLTSFYADKGRSVRKIDPANELMIAEKNGLIGELAGAKVYIIGAGLLPTDTTKTRLYRDSGTMQALSSFWSAYIEKSKGQLVEFGQPALLNPVH